MNDQLLNTKSANLGGGGGETEFEQAFSSLAFAYLRDKAPRLLDHMVGFQLVDRNDDNTKAMGVFGFKVGNQWLYAPVFFLNGDLKGHELLYIKSNDSFVPMKENWVNYIMSRKPHVLGEETEAENLSELGGVYPDIRSLSVSPSIGGGKQASSNDWVKGILPLIAAFKVKAANSLYRGHQSTAKIAQESVVESPFEAAYAKTAGEVDLNVVLPQSFALLKQAYSICESFPMMKVAVHRLYGDDCFSRWGNELKDSVKAGAGSIMPVKQAKAKPYMPGNLLIPMEAPAEPVDHEKSGKLRMYVYEQVIVNKAPELTSEDREQLQKDTVLIKDERSGDEVSVAYNTQVEAKLTNPSETDLYRVLEKPGKFSKMLIAMNGYTNRGPEAMATVIRLEDSGNKRWLNTHPTNVFADQVAERDEWDEWFEGLSDSEQLKSGGLYLAVGQRGACSCPFRVLEAYDDGRYRVDFKSNIDWNETRSVTMPRISNNYSNPPYDGQASTYNAMLYVDKEGAEGKRIKAIAGELRVPSNFKFMSLEKPEPKKSPNSIMDFPSCCSEDRSDNPPINLGKIDDIQLLFTEKTARIKLFNNGTDVHISSPLGSERLSKKAALFRLVGEHGFTEKIAREMLKVSEQKGHAIYRASYAAGYGTEKNAAPNMSTLAGGPSAALQLDQFSPNSSEDYGPRTSAMTQEGGEAAYRVDGMSADQTDPNTYDNFQNYQAEDFQNVMQVAQQAGQDGQKEVFDVSMMAGMLKSVRDDSLVERYLGTLLEGVDATGRLLLNFYWHSDEFEDRYGKADMPELEDSIRNTFEAAGDLTLFLKEKTVESPFEDGDVDLDDVASN